MSSSVSVRGGDADTRMIRVAVTTGSQRLNQALHALLRERGRFEIITGTSVLDEFGARDSEMSGVADVVVTDIPARADEGGAAVLLSDEEELLAGVRPLRGGLALLPTSASPDQLIAAIEATAAGLAVVHPDHAGSLAARPSDDPLTPREREVLHLLAAGLGNKEIANRLVISDHTAKFHVSQILAKLNAASRAEAVSIAMRRGLVPL
jgi:two-component system, NarL family, nitrate/nitrite response regulator NarL